MAYVKNWLHCVWGTKCRFPFLTKEHKRIIINHIKSNVATKGIHIDSINGYLDHMHCLLSLNPDQSLAKVMQLIKGESSFWINRNLAMSKKFEWADEYYAISISESHLSRVRAYIINQETHHLKNKWKQEYEMLFEEIGFDTNEG